MKKMEKEMENVFETKVKEKKQKLKDSEHELTQKHKNVSCSLSVMVRAALLYGIGLTFFALSPVQASTDGLSTCFTDKFYGPNPSMT